jgi:hypothetical protein
MLVNWLFLYFRETRAYFTKIFLLVFKPAVYARSIALNDERNFRRSVNFFLASASSYIAIGSLLQKLDSNHIILQNFGQDFVVFGRVMLNLLVWSALDFLGICLLLRQRLSFSNFFHCSLHIAILGMALHLYTIIATSVLSPPMNQLALDVFSEMPKSNPFAEMCLADQDHLTCRSFAGGLRFGTSYARTLYDFGMLGDGEREAVTSAIMTGLKVYTAFLAVALFLPLVWAIYAQASLIGVALNVSRGRTAIALVATSLLFSVAYVAFPPIMASMSGSGFSRQIQELQHLLGQ